MTQINLNVKTSILPNEIMYFEADVNYTVVYYRNRKEMVCMPLKKIEEKLRSFPFCRIHKSYLVNINFIADRKNRLEIEMKDKAVLAISRRKSSAFNRFMKKNAMPSTLTKRISKRLDDLQDVLRLD